MCALVTGVHTCALPIDAPRLKQFGGREARARGIEAKPGEALKDDPRQAVPVADDVGEDADEQRLLDEASKEVVVGAPAPEQSGQRHVDDDQRRGNERHLAAEQAEPAVNITGEYI